MANRKNKKNASIQDWAEIKRQFVYEKLSPEKISKGFNNVPSANTIRNHAAKADPKSGKTWYDLQKEFADSEFERIAPGNLVRDVMLRISKVLSNPDLDDNRVADALAKFQKSLERLADPANQVPAMYATLTGLMQYIQQNYKDLITDRLVEAVKDYRTEIRKRLG